MPVLYAGDAKGVNQNYCVRLRTSGDVRKANWTKTTAWRGGGMIEKERREGKESVSVCVFTDL